MGGEFSKFAQTIINERYARPNETWAGVAHRVSKNVLGAVKANDALIRSVAKAIRERKFIPGGRYLSQAGRRYHQVNNCLLLRAEDSREGWAELQYKATLALASGAGIGVDYSRLRGEGAEIKGTGGFSSGPLALMQMINEVGRFTRQGGTRRCAIWAGLNWAHPDTMSFIRAKNWHEEVRKLKAKDFNFPAPLDMTNISVLLDDAFFKAITTNSAKDHKLASSVYWAAVKRMLKTGEPGFSIDVGDNAGETLRNACTEITSADDSDVCNLGSINLARTADLDEFSRLVELGTAFLLAGTVYSDVPYDKVSEVRTKNRRIGLGLMGLHEWLLKRGKKYAPDAELEQYLALYRDQSERSASAHSKAWGLRKPIKTRAIAPTGTIGIVGETTTGIEPIFCAAFKRRYLKHKTWCYQYVIDPTAARLIAEGVSEEALEDAYSIGLRRRLGFQSWVQQYVDHGISSTINIPPFGSEKNNDSTWRSGGQIILDHLPNLRGLTVYPDGARDGQPLTPVKISTARKHIGEVYEEPSDICDITRGGTCGE